MDQQQKPITQAEGSPELPLDYNFDLGIYALNFQNSLWSLPYFYLPKYSPEEFPLNMGPELKSFFYTSTTTQTLDSDFEKESVKAKDSFASENQLIISSDKQKSFSQLSGDKIQIHSKMIDSEQMDQEDNGTSQKAQKDQKNEQTFQSDALDGFRSKQQFLQKMLKEFSSNPQSYQAVVSEGSKDDSLFSLIIRYFDSKIISFKKSKEEMIKLIIRKTQRYYKIKHNCKRDERFKKYGGFKSMNAAYLEKIFSDSQFAQCFFAVQQTFLKEFQQENNAKMSVFLSKACSATNWEDFKRSVKSLDQKNKMPWPVFWIEKLKKVIEELEINYLRKIEKAEMQTKSKRKV